jgi:tetratricopeptide (TPR) repeat protein
MLLPFLRRRPPVRLTTTFGLLESRPFPVSSGGHYTARYERGTYALTLRRDSYFAWEALPPTWQCGDFVLETEMELDPGNGHSAIGVLFRRVDDENFYSFMISTRGNFRLDLLFNKHPLRLVEWTALPDAGERRAGFQRPSLRIVGHGSRFSFHVDDEWVAEVDDETLPRGDIAFAAQNFAGAGAGIFRLRRIALETGPVAVEREHLRSVYYVPVNPAARLRLAETLATMGRFDPAAVQLRKGLKDREGTSRERFLLAQCYARLSLPAEALGEIEKILAKEPAYPGARLERARLLYVANRLLEARDAIAAGLADGGIEPAPAAYNLLGNAEYALGNWDRAADAYRCAIDIEPLPLFLGNAARALERAGRAAEALPLYLRAARALFADEAFDELSLLLPRLRALAPEDPDVRGLEAKMLYREGKTEEAFTSLRALAAEGNTDSAVHYILGLILSSLHRSEEALACFRRAAELAPDFPLYHFRVAETLHLLGRDGRPALERSLSLAPDDPWANNLAGQMRLDAGDPAGAVEPLRRARTAAPGEQDIAFNLAEALSLSGRHDEALAVVAEVTGAGDTAKAANLRGNIVARTGEPAEAVREYETAIRLDPENTAYKENCAAACIEIDMVHRAEELLAQVEPEHPSASVYNLLGQVAALKGERARAEMAFGRGLEMAPGDPAITVNLALVLRDGGRHEKAKSLVESLLAARPGYARAAELLSRIRDEHEERLTCATCGREWWVPRNLPPQPALRVRGEPPASAPAGKCPRCGRVFCVGCAAEHVREMRFYCPEDGEILRLSDDGLKWLLARAVEAMPPETGKPPAEAQP